MYVYVAVESFPSLINQLLCTVSSLLTLPQASFLSLTAAAPAVHYPEQRGMY